MPGYFPKLQGCQVLFQSDEKRELKAALIYVWKEKKDEEERKKMREYP